QAPRRRRTRKETGNAWKSSSGGSLVHAGQEGRQIGDVLVGKALGLGLHGRMAACAPLVLGQGVGQVFRRLADDLGHAVGRVGVPVLADPVAAHAGIGQGAPFLGRALRGRCGGGGLLGCCRERQGGEGEAGGKLQRSHHVVIRNPV